MAAPSRRPAGPHDSRRRGRDRACRRTSRSTRGSCGRAAGGAGSRPGSGRGRSGGILPEPIAAEPIPEESPVESAPGSPAWRLGPREPTTPGPPPPALVRHASVVQIVNSLQCPVRRLGRSSQSYLFWRGSHMRIVVSCTAVAALGAAVIGPAATEARLFRASEQFERVATFVVCENTSCDRTKVEHDRRPRSSPPARTAARWRTPTAALGAIGFVDITNPGQPKGAGRRRSLGRLSPPRWRWPGAGCWSAVDTSESFTTPSGRLDVFDLAALRGRTGGLHAAASIDMGGQPDAVAVSPDRRFAAIVIENQRDEDVNRRRGSCRSFRRAPPGRAPRGPPDRAGPRARRSDRPRRLRARRPRARIRQHQRASTWRR